ncbi:hypothetical protein F3Y22_tig00117010pilonHSYRG00050 [Hibiscus syriacus]|uniref:Uncharacterized protein n=1 Tax=Hibiscus syriacus TaxID=106335 RepID=A0A6A2WPP7_HIBSY|nr:hypothetical protein F3Y22_tig00117010pilonHSYRG00050 [Hibiscus syriacus]
MCSQEPSCKETCYKINTGGCWYTAKLLDPKSPRVSPTNGSGYVKKMWQYVVIDGLVVKSLSRVSSIALLQELGLRPNDVEQQMIYIGEVEVGPLPRF